MILVMAGLITSPYIALKGKTMKQGSKEWVLKNEKTKKTGAALVQSIMLMRPTLAPSCPTATEPPDWLCCKPTPTATNTITNTSTVTNTMQIQIQIQIQIQRQFHVHSPLKLRSQLSHQIDCAAKQLQLGLRKLDMFFAFLSCPWCWAPQLGRVSWMFCFWEHLIW